MEYNGTNVCFRSVFHFILVCFFFFSLCSLLNKNYNLGRCQTDPSLLFKDNSSKSLRSPHSYIFFPASFFVRWPNTEGFPSIRITHVSYRHSSLLVFPSHSHKALCAAPCQLLVLTSCNAQESGWKWGLRRKWDRCQDQTHIPICRFFTQNQPFYCLSFCFPTLVFPKHLDPSLSPTFSPSCKVPTANLVQS